MTNLLSYSLPQEGMFTSNRSVLKMFFFKIFSAFLLSVHCNQPTKDSTTPTKPNEVKYVFAAAGLRLREAPDLNAKNIITLPYGTEVEILRKTGSSLSINYYMSGEWVEAKWKDKTGYAFDGYLLDKKEFQNFDIANRYVQLKFLDKLKNEKSSVLSKYRLDEKWKVSDIYFKSKESNSNFTIYTFFPVKSGNCDLYGGSTCINTILRNNISVVFTDIDFEAMGYLDYLDDEIARFGVHDGEGDGCSSASFGTEFVYIFSSKMLYVKTYASGEVCRVRCDPSKMDFCPDKIKQPDDETFFNAKHETIKPSAKIKEYFKRTKESEKK